METAFRLMPFDLKNFDHRSGDYPTRRAACEAIGLADESRLKAHYAGPGRTTYESPDHNWMIWEVEKE